MNHYDVTIRETLEVKMKVAANSREEAEQVGALLKREMENAVHMQVPLTAEVKTGRSWYETK